MEAAAGRRKTSVLIFLGSTPGPFQKAVGLVVEDVLADQPVELFQGLADLGRIRGTDRRVRADGKEPFDLALIHLVEEMHEGIVFPVVQLGQPGVAEIVFLGGLVVAEGLQEADEELRIILIVIGRLGILRFRRVFLQIFLQRIEGGRRHLQIAGQIVVEDAMIRGTLDVRLAAQGVDAAAGDAHVAQEELDHGHGPDDLAARRMVGPAQGVAFRSRLVRDARGAVFCIDLEQVFLGDAGDAGDLIQGVAGVMLLHHLEDAAGIGSGSCPAWGCPCRPFPRPRCPCCISVSWRHSRRRDRP